MSRGQDSASNRAEETSWVQEWVAALLAPANASQPVRFAVKARRNGWGELQENLSYENTPLKLGGKVRSGWCAHADSEIVVSLAGPARRFRAIVGVDENPAATRGSARVVFAVTTSGRQLWRSAPLGVGQSAEVDVDLGGASEFILTAMAENGEIHLAHADWAEPRVILSAGPEVELVPASDGHGPLGRGCPFSFKLGGRLWSPEGGPRVTPGIWKHGRRVSELNWTDAAAGLDVTLELTDFTMFSAIEWVVRLSNCGANDSELISEVNALDLKWSGGNPILHHSRGSACRRDDFLFYSDPAEEFPRGAGRNWRSLRLTPGPDGRPSNDCLPFFNLQTGETGVMLGLGWSGQWFAEFTDRQQAVQLRAGQEHFAARLHPGESIRTPRILLLPWTGQAINGHNQLRRFLLQHHVPQASGRPVEAPLCNGAWGGMPTSGHLELIERFKREKLGYDYYWVDAGWYGTSAKPCPDVFGGDWSQQVGDWRVNRNYHPQDLKPIADAAHAAGMKFLLWVEPERAKQGAPVTLEHPEWFLTRSGQPPKPGEDLLLDLGRPEARQWAIETISGLIRQNGIDCYREDYNFGGSAECFLKKDEPGRRGISEIRFVEGLYEFWDELRRRFPDLLIDNCASGGRRIDLETLSRSIPLWRSDYNCHPQMQAEGAQIQSFGLAHWVPLSAISPCATPGDTYQVRSALSAGLVFSLNEFNIRPKDTDNPAYPWDWHKKMMAEHRRARPCFYGDFYPHTRPSAGLDAWQVSQYHRPDLDAGLILAFRRPESPFTTAELRLAGLEPQGEYEFEDADGPALPGRTGAQLAAAGLTLMLAEPRSSRLIFYRRRK